MNNSQRIRIKAFQRLGIALILLMLIICTGSASASGVISQTNGVKQQGEDPPPPERSPQVKHDEIPLESMGPEGSVTTDLFNQMDQVSGWGIVSQDVLSPLGNWSAEAADDFTIPVADGSWTINSIDVIGFCRDLDFNPYDCINRDNAEINIYQDGGVVPGDRIYISFNNTVTAGPLISDNVRIYTINLATPVVLTAGTYWISVAVDMGYWDGDWLWNERLVQNGNSFAWRNPGGGWEVGCTDWCSNFGYYPDLNFRLNGVSGNPYIVPLTTGEVYAVVEHGTQSYIYASVPQSNIVQVANAESDSIVTSISVGSNPQGLTISPDSSRVFVALNGGNAVKVIDTATNTVTDTFSLSYQPIELGYGGLGRLYVSDGNDIESLDPSNGNLVSTLPSNTYAGGVIAISPDGQTLCSSRTGSSNAAITCYDISTDSPPAPWTSTIRDDNLRNIDISGDGAYLYTAFESFCAVRAYNLSTLTQVGLFSWGGYPDYAISVYDSYLGDRVFISEAGGSWAWDAQTYLPLQILDNREVKFLGGGRDNFTAYATDSTDDTLLIYHYTSFGDLSWTHWARNWIEALYRAGLTSGYPDGTYRPQNSVTRAEMAVFLLKGMGVTPLALDGSHPFSDIAGHWAEAWIEELYDQGITGGYPDGTYRPENQVTRAEMAIFLLKGIGVTPPPLDGSHPFSDIAGHWAEIFIEELYDQGITGGYPDGTYRPENQVTRAEMAVFLVNAFGLPTLQVNP